MSFSSNIEDHLLLEQYEKRFVNGIFVPLSYTFKIAEFLERKELNSIFLLGYSTSIEKFKIFKEQHY